MPDQYSLCFLASFQRTIITDKRIIKKKKRVYLTNIIFITNNIDNIFDIKTVLLPFIHYGILHSFFLN